jgi:hypothetical protein
MIDRFDFEKDEPKSFFSTLKKIAQFVGLTLTLQVIVFGCLAIGDMAHEKRQKCYEKFDKYEKPIELQACLDING